MGGRSGLIDVSRLGVTVSGRKDTTIGLRMAEAGSPGSQDSPHSDDYGGNHNSGDRDNSNVREQDRFLPIANISRIMKKALPANAKIAKDAKETIQECVSEFISFITSEYPLRYGYIYVVIVLIVIFSHIDETVLHSGCLFSFRGTCYYLSYLIGSVVGSAAYVVVGFVVQL